MSHRINTHNQFVLLTLDPEKLVEALCNRPHIDRSTALNALFYDLAKGRYRVREGKPIALPTSRYRFSTE